MTSCCSYFLFMYILDLKIGDKEYKSRGNTIIEAFSKIKPTHFRAMGKLHIKQGKKDIDILIGIFNMKRLFGERIVKSHDIYKELYIKNLTRALDNG